VNRRPTGHDVAAHAGVSIKTVSRVVDRSPSVSDAVRGRVSTDFPLARTLQLPVTVVNQDPHRIDVTAAERLLGRLGGSIHGPGQELMVHTELIERGSFGLRPAVLAR